LPVLVSKRKYLVNGTLIFGVFGLVFGTLCWVFGSPFSINAFGKMLHCVITRGLLFAPTANFFHLRQSTNVVLWRKWKKFAVGEEKQSKRRARLSPID
jgi:hypothetical protein